MHYRDHSHITSYILKFVSLWVYWFWDVKSSLEYFDANIFKEDVKTRGTNSDNMRIHSWLCVHPVHDILINGTINFQTVNFPKSTKLMIFTILLTISCCVTRIHLKHISFYFYFSKLTLLLLNIKEVICRNCSGK